LTAEYVIKVVPCGRYRKSFLQLKITTSLVFMKSVFASFILLVLISLQTKGQSPQATAFYSKEFNWKIMIPPGFNPISKEEWAKAEEKGASAIENTVGEKIENRATTLFAYKLDTFHSIDANYQPFAVDVDGDYGENFTAISEMLVETFLTEMPTIAFDSSSSRELIDGLEFHCFKLKINFPNNTSLWMIMYSRIFGKNDFTINFLYKEEEKGKEMLNAWRSSRFER
jgi:hypothetical protein